MNKKAEFWQAHVAAIKREGVCVRFRDARLRVPMSEVGRAEPYMRLAQCDPLLPVEPSEAQRQVSESCSHSVRPLTDNKSAVAALRQPTAMRQLGAA
jgi:hypothetical protein